MMPAQEKLEKDLRAIKFADLQMPLVTNVDADTIRKGEEASSALVRQVTMPVRWEESMRMLLDEGVNTFVEVGPGPRADGIDAADRAVGDEPERGRRKEPGWARWKRLPGQDRTRRKDQVASHRFR